MIEMDGRNSAEYQIWEKRDIKVIFGKVKSQNDKLVNMTHLLQIIKKQKREDWGGGGGGGGGRCSEFQFERILEREREYFSLEIHAIQPLAVFGTRRRTALRGEGFTCVPNL